MTLCGDKYFAAETTDNADIKMAEAEMANTTLELFDTVKSARELDEALTVFVAAPCFSSKQKALELLFRNICAGTWPAAGQRPDRLSANIRQTAPF